AQRMRYRNRQRPLAARFHTNGGQWRNSDLTQLRVGIRWPLPENPNRKTAGLAQARCALRPASRRVRALFWQLLWPEEKNPLSMKRRMLSKARKHRPDLRRPRHNRDLSRSPD